MATLREQIDSRMQERSAPVPVELVSLDGLRVYVRQATTRQVREWWHFQQAPGKPVEQRPTYDKVLAEMFMRFCVDESDAPLFTNADDLAALLDRKGSGKVLAEFEQECRRVNWLFLTDEGGTRERESFFARRAQAAPLTLATTPSGGSPAEPATRT